ncbi:MAG: hypothetical protein ABIM89_15805, partial [Mycobacteriales bacterium]
MSRESWCWFAVLRSGDAAPAVPALATATATHADGSAFGVLAAWPSGRKPVPHAVRMDARVVDPAGEAAWVSLVQIAADRAPLFDDPAVSGAMRAVLAGQRLDAVTTFVRDSSHFAGSMCVSRSDPARLREDPFAQIRAAVLLRVESGLLGQVAPPPGPVTQR